jgi:hypothetical protein
MKRFICSAKYKQKTPIMGSIRMFEEMKPPKRVQYFTGQVLDASDLQAAQDYQNNKRRLDRLSLHGFGIVDRAGSPAFAVRTHPEKAGWLLVGPGYGFDPRGRDLCLSRPVELSLEGFGGEDKGGPELVYVVAAVSDRNEDFYQDPNCPAYQGYRRVHEEIEITLTCLAPTLDGLELARILISDPGSTSDPEHPDQPGLGEINRNHVNRIPCLVPLSDSERAAVSSSLQSLRVALRPLANQHLQSALELRMTLSSIIVLLCGSGFDVGDWSRLSSVLEDSLGEFEEDVSGLSASSLSPGQGVLFETLKGYLGDLRGNEHLASHEHAVTALIALSHSLSHFASSLKWDSEDPHIERAEIVNSARFQELEEEISLEEDLGERGGIPETVAINSQLFRLVDELVLLDELSESDHELRIESEVEKRTSTRTFRYCDGRVRSASGRIFKGGSMSWTFKGLGAGDVLLVRRVDVGEAPCDTKFQVGAKDQQSWITKQGDGRFRWRNGVLPLAAKHIVDGRLNCKLSPLTDDSEVNIYGIWLYQEETAGD